MSRTPIDPSMTHTTLADAVERGAGPSAELDLEIAEWCLQNGGVAGVNYDPRLWVERNCWAPTASLDVALSIMPAGWQLTLRQMDGLVRWGADLSHEGLDVEVFSTATSAARAITAASLRALSHTGGDR